jgi:hypothetical protein
MVPTRAWVQGLPWNEVRIHVTSRRDSRPVDHPACDVASAAAGDAASMSEHNHVPLGPWHGRWGD